MELEVLPPEEIFAYLDEIKKVNYQLNHWLDIIKLVLNNKARLILCRKNAKPIGVLIAETTTENFFIILVISKNKAKVNFQEFYKELKRLNYKKIAFYSARNSKAIERAFKVNHITSVFEKEL